MPPFIGFPSDLGVARSQRLVSRGVHPSIKGGLPQLLVGSFMPLGHPLAASECRENSQNSNQKRAFDSYALLPA
jgi:hypothetical protein